MQNIDLATNAKAFDRITANAMELSCYIGNMGEFDHLAQQATFPMKVHSGKYDIIMIHYEK